eukprot:2335391-Pyramimonas_sp.AAC.1
MARFANDQYAPLSFCTNWEEKGTPVSSMKVRLLDPLLIPLQPADSEFRLQGSDSPELKHAQGGDGAVMIMMPFRGRSSQRSTAELN